MTARAQSQICIARIVGVHGVRGQVRLRAFTDDPKAVAKYGAVTDGVGRVYTIKITGQIKENLIVTLSGISTREQAEALKNVDLFVERGQLPKPKRGEYYHADLVGCAVMTDDGVALGSVAAIHDFGAGTIIEVSDLMLPFSKKVLRSVDIENKKITVALPGDWGNDVIPAQAGIRGALDPGLRRDDVCRKKRP